MKTKSMLGIDINSEIKRREAIHEVAESAGIGLTPTEMGERKQEPERLRLVKSKVMPGVVLASEMGKEWVPVIYKKALSNETFKTVRKAERFLKRNAISMMPMIAMATAFTVMEMSDEIKQQAQTQNDEKAES